MGDRLGIPGVLLECCCFCLRKENPLRPVGLVPRLRIFARRWQRVLSRPGPEDFEKFPRDRVPEAWDEFSEILSPARSSCAVSMKLCECVRRH